MIQTNRRIETQRETHYSVGGHRLTIERRFIEVRGSNRHVVELYVKCASCEREYNYDGLRETEWPVYERYMIGSFIEIDCINRKI